MEVTAMTVTTDKWTIERYHQAIAEGLFQDCSVELLQGEIVVMPSEGVPHAYSNTEVADYLRTLLGDRVRIRDAKPVTLPNDSEPEPDIAVVKPLGKIYLDHHPYPDDIFWLIEFSQATLSKDLGRKKSIYAEAGIGEYWVVNLNKTQLRVFRDLVDGKYTTELTLTEGAITPSAFPDIQIQVANLLAP
jgi:Uma2 family endonuclease